MTYSKPEVTNAVRAIAAVQSDMNKLIHVVPDSITGQPLQASPAYEADE